MSGHIIRRFTLIEPMPARLVKPEPLLECPTLASVRENTRKGKVMVHRLQVSIIHVIAFFAFLAPLASAQAQQPVQRGQSYRVLSVTPSEVLVLVQPAYRSQIVKDANGRAYTEITFPGGVTTDSTGAQSIQRLNLAFLAPSLRPATVEIVNQKLDVMPGIDLAPVPAYRKDTNGDLMPQYIVHADR